MRGVIRSPAIIGMVILTLAACNGAPATQTETGNKTAANHAEATPKAVLEYSSLAPFGDNDAELKTISCPYDTRFVPPLEISVVATELHPPEMERSQLDGLQYVGGWRLKSPEPNFGGLSGLDAKGADSLLAVSDSGAFVSIDLKDNAPSGTGSIAYMQAENGTLLSGKTEGDAEGLDMSQSGLALVSFERDHRILAFDLGTCGAAARGTLVRAIGKKPSGLKKSIPDNQGAEALMLDSNGYLVAGLEAPQGEHAAIGHVSSETVSFNGRIKRPPGTSLVGLDRFENGFFALFRGYSPLSGNTIVIHHYETYDSTPRQIALLKKPFLVDNFEGITAVRLSDGRARIYIISDDNFSASQLTLLLAFDFIEPTEN